MVEAEQLDVESPGGSTTDLDFISGVIDFKDDFKQESKIFCIFEIQYNYIFKGAKLMPR